MKKQLKKLFVVALLVPVIVLFGACGGGAAKIEGEALLAELEKINLSSVIDWSGLNLNAQLDAKIAGKVQGTKVNLSMSYGGYATIAGIGEGDDVTGRVVSNAQMSSDLQSMIVGMFGDEGIPTFDFYYANDKMYDIANKTVVDYDLSTLSNTFQIATSVISELNMAELVEASESVKISTKKGITTLIFDVDLVSAAMSEFEIDSYGDLLNELSLNSTFSIKYSEQGGIVGFEFDLNAKTDDFGDFVASVLSSVALPDMVAGYEEIIDVIAPMLEGLSFEFNANISVEQFNKSAVDAPKNFSSMIFV